MSHQYTGEDKTVERLIGDLCRRFGADAVAASHEFSDLARDEAAEAISKAFESCRTVLVLIGPHWPGDDRPFGPGPVAPFNQTIAEIDLALKSDLLTIPVLLEDAQLDVDRLPEHLKELANRATHRVTATTWDDDIERLLSVIEVNLERVDETVAPGAKGAEAGTPADITGRDTGEAGPAPILVDENVQFTVFRRSCVQVECWYPLVAFAHLSERRGDSPDEPDPVAEVQAQAAAVLGDEIAEFRASTQDSGYGVMREGELRFVPRMEGVEFNPPERRFFWTESVHREEFRMRASRALHGRVARGMLTVYAGNLVLADVPLTIKVDDQVLDTRQEQSQARPYRRIFASYSHRDTAIVEEFESHAAALGDSYLRDVVTLRAGEVWSDRLLELIKQADVFQLFWSWNALASPMVRAEWQHALALNRPFFVRPVFWEEPFPEQQGLPPSELRRLHFQRVYPRVTGTGTPASHEERSSAAPVPVPAPAAEPARVEPPPRHAPGDRVSGAPPHAPVPPAHDTGAVVTLPRHRPTSTAPRSNLRLIRYAALAAVCVIGLSLLAALRPFLMSSSAPPAGGGAPSASGGPPPTTTPPIVSQPNASASARAEVEDVVREYGRAWSQRDPDALGRVAVMPPQAERRARMEIGAARQITVSQDVVAVDITIETRANVTVVESRAVTARSDGRVRRTRERRVYQLEKRGNTWRIVSIVPSPVLP